MLVSRVVGIFAVRGWRPGPLWWTLGAGLVIFAGADSIYLLRVTSGTCVTGTPLDSLWAIAAFTIALASWQRMSDEIKNSQVIRAPNVVPALFLLSSLGVIVYASARHGIQLGVVLAGITLVIAIGR